MLFEYAASYPSEAQEALVAKRSAMKKCFSLLNKTSRALIDAETSIESQREGEGYWWKIQISPKLREHMNARAVERLKDIPFETIEKFKSFEALSDDTPGQLVEMNPTSDSHGNAIFEMWSQREGKAIATISGNDVEFFQKWLKFRDWLS